jgi:hypothetical protein
MFNKSQLTRMIGALMIQQTVDVEELTRLRTLPYHDRSKSKGKSKPGKVYRASTNKFTPHQGVRECARRLSRATR